ncbi:glyoxylase-like metal-dependent hydrolase (beta-lactamase superfamily II) [Amycolatopsis cihanbeyliensis]|uniref:Glyoxylase-like metal-dependent hydrolase (Beta-lactamase superfamily II) n=2 Tax=Amycolatopsis cihanbeyliensis TaxID=1128664 RepID=A0A542DC98_AMYCI|nr:glyoxylase-like metal-dependent hydrolase (beta-lactamase superfamily II) [Amycolatopsis cihanbeyliensis]
MLTQIRNDLWETSTYSPFPGLRTHAYLWTPPSGDNVLFYSTGGSDDFDAIEQLGGAAHQYLSHRDEAGPALAQIRDRFDARLHASAAEEEEVREFAEPGVLFTDRHIDGNGIEVIPTPGHSPGSTCFLVTGAGGLTYLFTGDTVFRDAKGAWAAGFIPDISDRDALAASLETLAALQPDLVVSSACVGDSGTHLLGATPWASCVDQAIRTLPAAD